MKNISEHMANINSPSTNYIRNLSQGQVVDKNRYNMQQIFNSCILGICIMLMHKIFLEIMFVNEANTLMVKNWSFIYNKNSLLIDLYVVSIVVLLNIILCKYKLIDFNCCDA